MIWLFKICESVDMKIVEQNRSCFHYFVITRNYGKLKFEWEVILINTIKIFKFNQMLSHILRKMNCCSANADE